MSKITGNNIQLENIQTINNIPIDQLGGGGSGESQSYITTGRSANNIGDLNAWTIYSNTAGVNPVNGFGGTANITLTRNTTNPLSGLGDFRITKDAVNRQGQGISIPFTIEKQHLASVLQISFKAELKSGIFINTFDRAISTYSVTSNVCTVTLPNQFTTGTKVRVVFTSGGAVSLSGDFTLTGATSSNFTFALTTANTSGNSEVSYVGDLRVSIVQDPSGTPVVIEPVGTDIQLAIAGSVVTVLATFQTHITIRDYRLAIHVSGSTSNAFSVGFNNFRIWEQERNYGTIETPWVDYPMTIGAVTTPPVKGTRSLDKAQWRRVGSHMQIRYDYIQTALGSATNGSGAYLFPLPFGSIDTTQLSSLNYNSITLGAVGVANVTGGSINKGTVNVYNANTLLLNIGNESNVFQNMSSLYQNIGQSNLTISFTASVPIAGWGTNMALSSDAGDGREVKAIYTFPTGTSTTTGGTNGVKPTSKIVDSHSIFDTSTGGATIPVAGNYRFTLNQINNSSTHNYYLWRSRGGGAITKVAFMGVISTTGDSVSVSYDCLVGDVMYISSNTGVASTLNATDGFQILCIEKLPSSSQIIAPVETVACSYYSASTQTSLTTQINFGTKLYDTHNAVTTGVGAWKFTAPMSGKYRLSGFCSGTATNLYLKLYKSGISYANICHMTDGTESYSIEVDLLVNDFIDIRPSGSLTINGHVNYKNDLASRIEISRIGI